MFLPINLAILAADLRPHDLGAMSLERARGLDGKTLAQQHSLPKAGIPASALLNNKCSHPILNQGDSRASYRHP